MRLEVVRVRAAGRRCVQGEGCGCRRFCCFRLDQYRQQELEAASMSAGCFSGGQRHRQTAESPPFKSDIRSVLLSESQPLFEAAFPISSPDRSSGNATRQAHGSHLLCIAGVFAFQTFFELEGNSLKGWHLINPWFAVLQPCHHLVVKALRISQTSEQVKFQNPGYQSNSTIHFRSLWICPQNERFKLHFE